MALNQYSQILFLFGIGLAFSSYAPLFCVSVLGIVVTLFLSSFTGGEGSMALMLFLLAPGAGVLFGVSIIQYMLTNGSSTKNSFDGLGVLTACMVVVFIGSSSLFWERAKWMLSLSSELRLQEALSSIGEILLWFSGTAFLIIFPAWLVEVMLRGALQRKGLRAFEGIFGSLRTLLVLLTLYVSLPAIERAMQSGGFL